MNKRQVGSRYEQEAAAYLEEQGCRILEQNFRCRQGEIDLIYQDGAYLVFAEVKYRSAGKFGAPAEAVDARKQARIRNTAFYYIYSRRIREDIPCRFDVISILGSEIEVIKDAFS